MGRQPCCEKEGIKKGPWSAEEDRKLVAFITTHAGHGCWRELPKRAGLRRCGKSCRLRWINYLRPDLKRGMFSMEEENFIVHLHACYGNKWSKIASQLPGRTDNEIKNCWNTRIKKKLREMGIDPTTHKPIISEPISNPSNISGVNHSTNFIQRTGAVNDSCFPGHLPFLLNISTWPATNAAAAYPILLHETLLESPKSVMNTHASSSLSQTSPMSKCDDDYSIASSDSLSQDHPTDSNMHTAGVHAPDWLTRGSDPLVFASRGLDDKDGFLNVSQYMLPIYQSVHQNAGQHGIHLHMHNHMLRDPHPHAHASSKPMRESHLHDSLHLLHPYKGSTSPIFPPLLQDSQTAQPYVNRPSGFGVTQNCLANSPTSLKYEGDIGKPVLDSRLTSSNDVELNSIKSKQDANKAGYGQALQQLLGEGNSGFPSAQGGNWSSMMLETILAESLEGPTEASSVVNETGEANLVGQQNLASAIFNSLSNGGAWSNVDCLLSNGQQFSSRSGFITDFGFWICYWFSSVSGYWFCNQRRDSSLGLLSSGLVSRSGSASSGLWLLVSSISGYLFNNQRRDSSSGRLVLVWLVLSLVTGSVTGLWLLVSSISGYWFCNQRRDSSSGLVCSGLVSRSSAVVVQVSGYWLVLSLVIGFVIRGETAV
ncbi:hypothetical protein L7F22_008205 [Adiantum nelumboides]|nr:hypothetical protein [Adiantum nelumboides]